jgi:hypothetical protein
VVLPRDARERNVEGIGGTPWTNARWQAREGTLGAGMDSSLFHKAFQALSDAGLNGDAVVWRDATKTEVVVRLPAQAVAVLRPLFE